MTNEPLKDPIFYIDPKIKREMWREMVEAWLEGKREDLEKDGLEKEEIEIELKKLKKRMLRKKD